MKECVKLKKDGNDDEHLSFLKATCYFTVTELIFVSFNLNVSVIANSFTNFTNKMKHACFWYLGFKGFYTFIMYY